MFKFLLYFLTKSFWKNVLIAICIVIALVLTLTYSLRVFTRHDEMLLVPNFTGLSIQQAQRKIEELGMRLHIDSVFKDKMQKGTVVSQNPDSGSLVKPGRSIYLKIVSTVAPWVVFPDVLNKTLREAQSLIENQGFKTSEMLYMPDIERDIVLAATYKGAPIQVSQELPKGSAVTLILGDGFGAAQVAIPNLRGLSLQEAIFTLRGHALMVGQVVYAQATDTLSAKVYKQHPAPGSAQGIQQGSSVDLFLRNTPLY